MKFVNLPVSRLSSRNSTLLEATAGLRYCQAAWACLPAFAYCDAEPWITFCRPLRVGASSVLNSWSRSTALVVSLVGITPPLGIFAAVAGPRRRST